MKVPKIVGWLSILAGLLMIIAGGVVWGTVSSQLAAENITVPNEPDQVVFGMAGKKVVGPLGAYAQADIINKHAMHSSEGKTYAELGAEAAKAKEAGDTALEEKLRAQRTSVMNASFLRASLFTSVVSFGVSALVMGLGLLSGLVGWALLKLAGRDTVAREVVVDRDGATAATA